jgi:hypothetical protein
LRHHRDSAVATITTQITINMWQGCEVWASLLMPLGVVVEEKERRRIAKMFQGIGGGGGGIMGAP